MQDPKKPAAKNQGDPKKLPVAALVEKPENGRVNDQNFDYAKILTDCRGLNQQIQAIISSHDIQVDSSEEITQTIVDVNGVLDALNAAGKNLPQLPEAQDLPRLASALSDFRNTLAKLKEQNSIVKFLTSNRLRKKIEESNSQVIFFCKRMASAAEKDKKPALQRRQTEVHFVEQEGKELWNKTFGLENNLVEWNKFIKGFSEYIKTTISLRDEMNLKKIMELAYEQKMNRILSEKFFHGFISRTEANKLLQDNGQTGTFLVRFSKTQPGAFALAFNGENNRVFSVMVESEMPKGVKVKEQGGNERRFKDLYDLLACYKEYLKRPLETTLTKEPWFQGDVSESECETLLNGKPPGTYLVRMGDQPRAFFVSFIANQGKINHLAIDKREDGSYHPARGADFHDWQEFLHASRSFLKFNYDRAGVPTYRIPGPLPGEVGYSAQGPKDLAEGDDVDDKASTQPADFYAVATSGYPDWPGGWRPICDQYNMQVLGKGPNAWTVMALADGCNWGPRPQTAALKAAQGLCDFVVAQRSNFTTTTEVGYLLLKAFCYAHERIIEGLDEIWEAGTTTLLGGILVPLDEGKGEHDPKWAFVCASVGDCKAFHYSQRTKQVVEVTTGNRGSLDATDPGGRLGPYVGRGEPDLRNLRLYFAVCEEGDQLLIMSDGVHDNLDPMSLGKGPKDVGFPAANDWKEVPDRDKEMAKDAYMLKLFSDLIANSGSPKASSIALVKHALNITQTSRDFMKNNPKSKLPSDYRLYPGKMDHTSCIGLRVGGNCQP